MDKTKTQPGFIHRFIPPKNKKSKATIGTTDDEEGTQRETFTTFLLLHGTGGNEEDLIPLAYQLDKDAAILSPKGKVLENGITPRFFRRLAEGVFDLEDLKFRTNELADFVIDASKSYNFDLQRVIAVGYSNGANIAASVLLLRPETFSGAILFRAMVPLEPEKPPHLANVRVWIGAGSHDPIIPSSETQRLVDLLRSVGADVTVRFLNAEHALTHADVSLAHDWLHKL